MIPETLQVLVTCPCGTMFARTLQPDRSLNWDWWTCQACLNRRVVEARAAAGKAKGVAPDAEPGGAGNGAL